MINFVPPSSEETNQEVSWTPDSPLHAYERCATFLGRSSPWFYVSNGIADYASLLPFSNISRFCVGKRQHEAFSTIEGHAQVFFAVFCPHLALVFTTLLPRRQPCLNHFPSHIAMF
jgi:hypothetical protein